jgi:hypothetical protein
MRVYFCPAFRFWSRDARSLALTFSPWGGRGNKQGQLICNFPLCIGPAGSRYVVGASPEYLAGHDIVESV